MISLRAGPDSLSRGAGSRALSRRRGRRCRVFCQLPRISEFIAQECPVRSLDGSYKERPRVLQPGEGIAAALLALDGGGGRNAAAVVVPGQRLLRRVTDAELARIVADGGRAVLAPLDSSSGSGGGGDAPAAVKLLAPPRAGSYACVAHAVGVMPGSAAAGGGALVRLAVVDRLAAAALDATSTPGVVVVAAAQFRDRWAFMVRAAAVEQAVLAVTAAAAGGQQPREVTNALQQLEDASEELLGLLRGLADSVEAATERSGSSVAAALAEADAESELRDLLAWCELEAQPGPAGGAGNDSQPVAALLERAWRLSFAPFAAQSLSRALGLVEEESAAAARRALEAADLGLRLEDAVDAAASLRAALSARLAIEQ